MPSPGTPLSQHLHVFTNLEALPSLYFWDFMEASSHECDQSLASFLAFLKRIMGGAKKAKLTTCLGLSSDIPHQGTMQKLTRSCLVRTKDTPMTQEITKI